jgi:hypothetical protein
MHRRNAADSTMMPVLRKADTRCRLQLPQLAPCTTPRTPVSVKARTGRFRQPGQRPEEEEEGLHGVHRRLRRNEHLKI